MNMTHGKIGLKMKRWTELINVIGNYGNEFYSEIRQDKKRRPAKAPSNNSSKWHVTILIGHFCVDYKK